MIMKAKLFVGIFFLILISAKAQNKSCNCNVVLLKKNVYFSIYNSPAKEVLDSIIDNSKNEIYHLITIHETKRGWAKINATTPNDSIGKSGWIEITNLGIYPNIYFKKLYLYAKPFKSSRIKSIILQPKYIPFMVIECDAKWLYVKYLDFDKKFKQGWLSPDNQCANPYSACN